MAKLERAAVFLDRDGVLNEDKGYVFRTTDLVVPPGVPESLEALRHAGYLLIVVTNQSGIARGYYTQADVAVFHAELQRVLRADGRGGVDGIYVCPHGPEDGCPCRKPQPGMLKQAAAEHGLDLARSWMIGDRGTDMACAAAAGVRGVQVPSTGEGRHVSAFAYATSLRDAARIVMGGKP